MRHVQLVNPNTSATTTAMMLEIARAAAPINLRISGLTVRRGPALIVDAAGLAEAAHAVEAMHHELTADGVVVAAFGDPGVDALRRALSVPVMGIGEAAIRAAVRSADKSLRRRFSIVTTTPKLEQSMRALVYALGASSELASIRITTEDPVVLTGDASRLEAELHALVERAASDDGAQAVIVGGGPLARAARAIAQHVSVEIIEPVPAAIAWMSWCLTSIRADGSSPQKQ